jgi:hypothetical protein
VAHTCSPSTQKAKAGESQVLDPPLLHCESLSEKTKTIQNSPQSIGAAGPCPLNLISGNGLLFPSGHFKLDRDSVHEDRDKAFPTLQQPSVKDRT